jgi:excisionase family DNA binding protein
MSQPDQDNDALMTPAEVAEIFRVDPKTVTRWASAGRVPSIRTPGGHRRFERQHINELRRSRILPSGPAKS